MTVVELVQALEKQMRRGVDPHAQVRIVGNQRWWSVRVEDGGGCVLLVAYDEHDPDDISTIPPDRRADLFASGFPPSAGPSGPAGSSLTLAAGA